MKLAQALYHGQGQEPVDGLLIENHNDIALLEQIIEATSVSAIEKMVSSKESPERMNHVLPGMKPLERMLGTLAVARASMVGKNPIFQILSAKEAYLSNITSLIDGGHKVFVNKNGGFCYLQPGTLEIISVREGEVKVERNKPFIAKNTTVINLENDASLENYSVNYMKRELGDQSYSYITELRLFSEEELFDIFKDFVNEGGRIVYVYTTGGDVDQMYSYARAALKAGLQNFIFCFNSGTNAEINDFISYLKSKASVKVEGVDYRFY